MLYQTVGKMESLYKKLPSFWYLIYLYIFEHLFLAEEGQYRAQKAKR